jgi:predicted RNase H-like HicB family nuclease
VPRKGLVAEMTRHKAVYERDESGAWIVHVPAVKGCHTYGRSIDQARERVREALGLFVEGDLEIEDDIRLPAKLLGLVRAERTARAKAKAYQLKANAALLRAARKLTSSGHSVRDTGALLKLSHQRVQQLKKEGRKKLVKLASTRIAGKRRLMTSATAGRAQRTVAKS